MDNVIWINTTRYSTLFRCILREYGVGSEILIDGHRYTERDIAELIATWCTNANIRGTRNFRLIRNSKIIFSFHDGPQELVVAYSELTFVQRLRQEKIIRYTITSYMSKNPSLLQRLVTKIKQLVN